jgi:hypothetical protein
MPGYGLDTRIIDGKIPAPERGGLKIRPVGHHNSHPVITGQVSW